MGRHAARPWRALPAGPRGARLPVAAAALAVLLLPAGCADAPPAAGTAGEAAAALMPDLEVVAPGQESAFTDVPGVDGMDALSAALQQQVIGRTNRTRCTCGCVGHTIATCLHQGEDCDVSRRLAASFVDDALAFQLQGAESAEGGLVRAGDAPPADPAPPAAAAPPAPEPRPDLLPPPPGRPVVVKDSPDDAGLPAQTPPVPPDPTPAEPAAAEPAPAVPAAPALQGLSPGLPPAALPAPPAAPALPGQVTPQPGAQPVGTVTPAVPQVGQPPGAIGPAVPQVGAPPGTIGPAPGTIGPAPQPVRPNPQDQ